MPDPSAFLRKRPGPPGNVQIGFRFHNDTGEVSTAEAYASDDGLDYEPVGLVDHLPPYTEAPAPVQFPKAPNPRFVRIEIQWNMEHFGPFIVGPSMGDINEVEAHLHYPDHNGPAKTPVEVEVRAWDVTGFLIAGSFPPN